MCLPSIETFTNCSWLQLLIGHAEFSQVSILTLPKLAGVNFCTLVYSWQAPFKQGAPCTLARSDSQLFGAYTYRAGGGQLVKCKKNFIKKIILLIWFCIRFFSKKWSQRKAHVIRADVATVSTIRLPLLFSLQSFVIFLHCFFKNNSSFHFALVCMFICAFDDYFSKIHLFAFYKRGLRLNHHRKMWFPHWDQLRIPSLRSTATTIWVHEYEWAH